MLWCCIIILLPIIVPGPSVSTLPKHLTHGGQMPHICVINLTIIGPDNGLSPGRRQAIIWTNAGILLIGPLGTNFSEILIGIQTFSFKKMPLKMSSAKWRPFSLGLNVLRRSSWTRCSLALATPNTPHPPPPQLLWQSLASNLWYKSHKIQKLKCFSPRLALQLSWPYPIKPGVKSRMKM